MNLLNPDFPNFLEAINELFQEWKEKEYWDSITKVEIVARQQQLFEAFVVMGQVVAGLQHQVKIIDKVAASNNTQIIELTGDVEDEEPEDEEPEDLSIYA